LTYSGFTTSEARRSFLQITSGACLFPEEGPLWRRTWSNPVRTILKPRRHLSGVGTDTQGRCFSFHGAKSSSVPTPENNSLLAAAPASELPTAKFTEIDVAKQMRDVEQAHKGHGQHELQSMGRCLVSPLSDHGLIWN
jgi:hypothetical protein